MEFTEEQNAFLDHIQHRMSGVYHQVSLKTRIDFEAELVTFFLWNLSGQFTGFLEYNWKGDKTGNNVEGGRYRVISPSHQPMYGLEWFNEEVPVTFVCEGVFDACSLLPFGNSVAVLSNQAVQLKQQISLLPGRTVAVCDGDKAGLELMEYTDDYVICPRGQDPNSMTHKDLKDLLGGYAVERDFFEDTFRYWWRKQGKNF